MKLLSKFNSLRDTARARLTVRASFGQARGKNDERWPFQELWQTLDLLPCSTHGKHGGGTRHVWLFSTLTTMYTHAWQGGESLRKQHMSTRMAVATYVPALPLQVQLPVDIHQPLLQFVCRGDAVPLDDTALKDVVTHPVHVDVGHTTPSRVYVHTHRHTETQRHRDTDTHTHTHTQVRSSMVFLLGCRDHLCR